MKKLLSFIVLIVLFVSCNETNKTMKNNNTTVNNKQLTESLKSIEVEIEGMTCEIGCARTIQSKLSKVKGVIYSKVDFETKKGVFTFDSNIITKEALILKIDGIAGGDLYSVSNTIVLPTIVSKDLK